MPPQPHKPTPSPDATANGATKGVSSPSLVRILTDGWIWRMAWRESRSRRRRLVFFSTSIMLGIAALVAVGSFGESLQYNVNQQTKSLLGADLVITSRQPFTESQTNLFQSFGGTQARGMTFSAMLVMPQSNQSRLVQVRAVHHDFPFYGQFESEPALAARDFSQGKGVLLENSLMIQYGISPGDVVRLGEWTGPALGGLERIPGSAMGFSGLAPRVYLPYEKLPETQLVKARSLMRYHIYFQFDEKVDADLLIEPFKAELRKERLSFDTVEERKEDLGRSMDNLYQFLNLAGFVALLLGSIGIASAIHVHIREKLRHAAVLRCLGAQSRQIFGIYLIQAIALGMIGTFMGTILGLVFQLGIPTIMADLIPFEMEMRISWGAVLEATALGFSISLLFALSPLLALRHISPLAAIRSEFETRARFKKDPWRWMVMGAIAMGITGFAISQTGNWRVGLGFTGGLGLALLLLALVAKGLMIVARRSIPRRLPFVWRQGLANLYRPQNRTLMLMLSLGLGTFLILSLYLSQHLIMTQLFPPAQTDKANAILFEIYPDQKDAVIELVKSMDLPILDEAAIVNMRLQSIRGRTVEAILEDADQSIPSWVLRREYRSTYRAELGDAESVIAGEWIGHFEGDWESLVPVSLEDGIARQLGVGLGDQLVFDVQGLPIATVVTSLRQVDWRRIQPNFFVVFPVGILEEAPGFHILATHVSTAEESARLQREVVASFSNVSAIDLTLVLQTIDSVLERVAFVIQFMALFTVATGLLVLAGAILTGRFQRIRECILLRTLGASRKQLRQILFAEYLFLGLLAGSTGTLLAVGGSWALATFLFKIDFALVWWPLASTLIMVTSLTITIGWLMNRGVTRHPPLQILRSETG